MRQLKRRGEYHTDVMYAMLYACQSAVIECNIHTEDGGPKEQRDGQFPRQTRITTVRKPLPVQHKTVFDFCAVECHKKGDSEVFMECKNLKQLKLHFVHRITSKLLLANTVKASFFLVPLNFT